MLPCDRLPPIPHPLPRASPFLSLQLLARYSYLYNGARTLSLLWSRPPLPSGSWKARTRTGVNMMFVIPKQRTQKRKPLSIRKSRRERGITAAARSRAGPSASSSSTLNRSVRDLPPRLSFFAKRDREDGPLSQSSRRLGRVRIPFTRPQSRVLPAHGPRAPRPPIGARALDRRRKGSARAGRGSRIPLREGNWV